MTTRQTTSPFALTRRAFVLSASAAAAFGIRAADGEKPLLRIGAMSDDHLHAERPKTHQRTKACFDLFRREQVDVVVDTGDIADLSHVTELQWFRNCFDTAFAGTDTVPFFMVANHDYGYVPGRKRTDPEIIRGAADALKMESLNPCAVVKGYRFASYYQDEKIEVLEENVRKAVAENEAGRPVFVVTHVPPFGTTTGTAHWSSAAIRKVLDKYPQVVHLSGHIHAAITWSANIWQGGFTAINLGAHAQYSNPIDGEATILDVYADRIDVRRYEAVSGREIGVDDHWSIPLPLDPAHGPYRPEARAAKLPKPAMPADMAAAFAQSADGARASLTFRSALPPGKTLRYLVTLESRQDDGSWKFLTTVNWRVPQTLDDAPVRTCSFVANLLEPGRRHRATVTPANSLERAGGAGVVEFDVPANPLQALPPERTQVVRVQKGQSPKGREIKAGADGWIGPDTNFVALLPEGLAAALKDRGTVTCVVDLGSEQGDAPCTLTLAKYAAGTGEFKMNVGPRIYTRPGKYAAHRYAWQIKARDLAAGDRLCVFVREGAPARYRFNSVRFFV